MRNLKKILALVLALVMSMSLVTIANAADFTDSDDISYEEAAEVMSAIGVIEGFENGSFDPDGTLTREQAAKLVTYMLLGTNADRLGIEGSTFKDVAATRWSAPAIEYCASLGLIDGAGDGNFYPAGQLTANAFAKILLTALGYSSEKEGMTGASWSVNVAALAIEVGLDNGIENLSWNAVLSREEAAQMALNAICAPLVAYENDVTIVVGDTPVSFGSGDAYYVTTTLAREQRISDVQLSNTKEYTVEFGERYFPNLRLVSESDEFERPCHTWVYENEEIGSYVDYNLLQETYTEGVTGEELYNLIGRTALAEYTLEVYVDGEDMLDKTDGISAADLRRNNDDDLAPTGRGVLTQVFVDHDDEVVTITCINTYLAQANGDYNERNETLSLTIYEGVTKDKNTGKVESVTTDTQTVDLVDVANIEGVEADQYVLVNMSKKDRSRLEVVKLEDAEVLTDVEVTRFSQSSRADAAATGFFSSLTADGNKYDASKKAAYNTDVLNLYDDGQLTNMTYNVYLDQYGYAIGVDLYEGTLNYVFITGYDMNGSNISVQTATAAGIFLDGSMNELRVNVSATNKNIDAADGKKDDNATSSYFSGSYGFWNATNADAVGSTLNRWYSYTETNGVYTLKPATRMIASAYSAKNINCSNVRLDGIKAGDDRAYGNDDSIYITVDVGAVSNNTKDVITEVTGTYTGVQDVDIEMMAPGSTGAITNNVYTVYDSDNYIIGSIVLGEAQGSSKNYAYVLSDEKSEELIGGTYYWEFDVVMGGQIQTLTAKGDYNETVANLKRGDVVELRFDGDYVVKVDDTISYDITSVTQPYKDGYTIYYISGIDGRKDTSTTNNGTLTLAGRTLYSANNDQGLTFLRDAKAVVLQSENGKDVESEYGSVSAALAALADANEKTNGLQYYGDIVAILDDRGVAEWVVFNSLTDLVTGPGTKPGGSTEIRVSSVDERRGIVWLDARDNVPGKNSDTNIYNAAVDALYDLGYRVTSRTLDKSTSPWSVKAVDMDSTNPAELVFSIDWDNNK